MQQQSKNLKYDIIPASAYTDNVATHAIHALKGLEARHNDHPSHIPANNWHNQTRRAPINICSP